MAELFLTVRALVLSFADGMLWIGCRGAFYPAEYQLNTHLDYMK